MNSLTDGSAVRKNESFQFGAPANVGTFATKSLESDRATAINDSTPVTKSLENDRLIDLRFNLELKLAEIDCSLQSIYLIKRNKVNLRILLKKCWIGPSTYQKIMCI